MGKQVEFYAVRTDHDALVDRVEALGLMALPPSVSDDEAPEPVMPRSFQSRYSRSRFSYLVPRELYPAHVRYRSLTQSARRRLVDEDSPVIEFLPSKIDGESVTSGRIYFGTRPGARGYDVAERQYNSLARWLRRWPKTEGASRYVGPETAAKARAGELRLLNFRTELRVADPE